MVQTKYFFSFIQYVTLAKLYNAIAIYLSFYLSKWTKKPFVWALPFSLSVEPTTACNLACPECPSGLKSFTRPTGNLKLKAFINWIQPIEKKLIYLNFYFQGEPYINPSFLDMVVYASAKKISTSTSTNAHFLTEETAQKTVQSGLHRLIISIDGTTQESYESYRKNGELNKVIQGTKNILEARQKLKSKTPYVIFQFLVVKHNEHQIDEIKKLADELGVDEVVFKTAQLYDFKNGNELMPENQQYSRYKKMPDGTYKIKNKLENQCWKMWHSAVITWDGRVVPCCFDKDAAHPMGNVNTQDFKTIWKGEAYMRFRKLLLRSRAEIDICKNCSEGTEVWLGSDV
jgi:radical SAM protein with 4Fe4S-binding SPASM domain